MEEGSSPAVPQPCDSNGYIYRRYKDEVSDLPTVMNLIDNELSEPYSIFTYRYFLHGWPHLCYLAYDGDHCFGVIVCKLDTHGIMQRGYIAMLVVQDAYRGKGAGTMLVKKAIEEMVLQEADEVVLEAEVTNKGALRLYENLGFLRDKRLSRYYLNGADAFRLKLLLPLSPVRAAQLAAEHMQSLGLEPTTGLPPPSNGAAPLGARPGDPFGYPPGVPTA